MTTSDQIPVISLKPYFEDGSKNVVQAIRAACEQIGFFSIVDHGFPGNLLSEMYQISRAFFDLPEADKRATPESGDLLAGLMYFPLKAERLAITRGVKTPGDVKESLDYGPGFYGSEWPSSPQGLHPIWLTYFESMSSLAGTLREIFALAVGRPADFFEDKFENHHSSVRVLNYPAQNSAPEAGQLRAGAHSDYGFLTILKSEASAGGLEVQTRAGEWIKVPDVPDAFVVNIGDAMQRWTNDAWVSTLHRVGNPPPGSGPQSRRQSMAFFHNPSKSAWIECLPGFSDPENPARYAPLTYAEYAQIKYEQAHEQD
jgi:isopenicillin N synthase-like dioxygenase